jgi:hypothetical protein
MVHVGLILKMKEQIVSLIFFSCFFVGLGVRRLRFWDSVDHNAYISNYKRYVLSDKSYCANPSDDSLT